MMRKIMNWTGLVLTVAAFTGTNALAEGNLKASQSGTDIGAPSSVLQIPSATQYYSPYAFVVDKKARMLSVWQQTESGLKRIAQFPADLGKKDGEKTSRGDHRTPEGVYFLQERLEGSSLDFKQYGKRAFTTDYPNFFDRLAGKTGSGIWLHAVPDEVPLTRGSRGCVVVRNNVILDLSPYVRLGRTPLIIRDKDDLLPQDELRKISSELTQWLDSWRMAWETKDLDNYISKYHEDFQWMKMNREQYRAYKSALNEKYKSISVKISRPLIFTHKGQAVARFLQEYSSDQHVDFGEKVLFLQKTKDGYRIIGETWMAESSQLAKEELQATSTASSISAGACATCSIKSAAAN